MVMDKNTSKIFMNRLISKHKNLKFADTCNWGSDIASDLNFKP